MTTFLLLLFLPNVLWLISVFSLMRCLVFLLHADFESVKMALSQTLQSGVDLTYAKKAIRGDLSLSHLTEYLSLLNTLEDP